ncbi:FlxA-like protein [Duganella sp. CF402]|uniref:FlxA-like family protein n=1 Tax=unclassified Duganella TaxID=2636909 RepID=UPI0008C31639|nr:MULTISPECIES: FlxA-like family protein [unclassified Duganella]RZT09332.1 FlxA-like protein [Duganella sp. BK701]SEL61421.1 FlxA-like protein [Duganella sp. CF402]
MNASNIVPAYLAQLSSTASVSGATESTTVRTAILKQIRKLQKVEAELGEQLAALTGDYSSGGIQQRIALQQQIDGIEQQIKALQIALLQEDADRKVTISKSDDSPAKDPAATEAAPKPDSGDKSAAIGTVINTAA